MKKTLACLTLAWCGLQGSMALAACDAQTLSVNPATGKYEINLGNCIGNNQAWSAEFDSSVTQAASWYPDTGANYWTAAVPSISGHSAHWELRGAMPDARFSSIQAYSLAGNNLGLVSDENYLPVYGASNWIQAGGRYINAASHRYNTVIREQVGSPPSGELWLDPAAIAATQARAAAIAYRVYPNTRRNGSGIASGLSEHQWMIRGQTDLPDLVYVVDDMRQPHFSHSDEIYAKNRAAIGVKYALFGVEKFADSIAPLASSISNVPTQLWQNPVRWQMNSTLAVNLAPMVNEAENPILASVWKNLLRVLPVSSAFANSASRYYVGGVNPSRGQVLITRLRAPSVADPDRGDRVLPRSQAAYQLRYWSVCINNALSLYNTGCLKDTQLSADSDGMVTIVLSNTGTAPLDMDGRAARNWLRYSSPNNLLLIRQMWSSPHFYQSLIAYGDACAAKGDCAGASDDVVSLAGNGGSYYPVSTYCSLNNYRFNNCRWVFNSVHERLYQRSPQAFARSYAR